MLLRPPKEVGLNLNRERKKENKHCDAGAGKKGAPLSEIKKKGRH